jgi:hypothetical protein
VVCVDEEKEMASGCSIDALGKMWEIDEEYQLGLFDRMKASFVENGEVKTLKLIDFKAKLRNGEFRMVSRFLIFLRILTLTF